MHQLKHQQIADTLLDNYHGQEPLANYLKKYFAANKKHGSRDRKSIASFCYDHFRQGEIKFPIVAYVSPELNVAKLVASHQIQPLLFIRIRPWQKEKVIQKLQAAQINFQEITPTTLAFANTTSLQNVLELNKEVVIQDLNSQALASLLKMVPTSMDKVLNVWDACAASGGKSILMFDYLDNIKIHVSDIRESILHNCEKRLSEAGIRPASVQVVDLVYPFDIKKQFDFIFADLPCSGSGTWGRTPENLKFFKLDQLEKYTQLQEKIIHNLIPAIQVNGYLLIATCSVYECENEKNIANILKTGKFKLIEQQYFKGYEKQADTLFGALLQKIMD